MPDTPEHDDRWRDPRWRSDVRRRLTRWFDANAREMPWRTDPTPYHVWVSEVMLQQTQVATVIPYWRRFMDRFPTVRHLAAADEDELLTLWEGLGYYRRARSLHAAAKRIVEEHGGEFPDRFEDVLALPGVGRYTAGAIQSISGDRRRPILEGNTVRVFTRWIAMRRPPAETASQKLLWEVAEAMLPPRRGSGRFNQAAMELGALVCRPQPECDACPVRKNCAAFEAGIQAKIPGKVTNIEYTDRREFALVIDRVVDGQRHYLLHRRSRDDRWAGLWDWPRPVREEYPDVGVATASVAATIGIGVTPGMRLMTLRHGVTRYRITLDVHAAELDDASRVLPDGWAWRTPRELEAMAVPVTARTIAERLENDSQGLLPLSV